MHLHHDYGPTFEESPRLRHAGQPMELLTGGAGMYHGAASNVAPQNANGAAIGASSGLAPHHGPIALVLLAVLVLFVLDRAGFRFAVTAGRR